MAENVCDATHLCLQLLGLLIVDERVSQTDDETGRDVCRLGNFFVFGICCEPVVMENSYLKSNSLSFENSKKVGILRFLTFPNSL